MKKVSASKLTNFDVHAFTNIVHETVLKSEKRLEQGLKSYIDEKIKQVEKKTHEQTEELTKIMDEKNNKQTAEICEVINNVMDTTDKLYVTKDEFTKHTSNLRAHQT